MGSIISSFLGSFFSFILLYKYTALFLISYIGAAIGFVPTSTSLASAAAFASQGYLNLWGVMAVALIGNVAGDATGYILARLYAENVLARIGFRKVLESKAYHNLKNYVFDYPQSVIYFSRFMTEIDSAVNLLAGLAQVPATTYFFFEVTGEGTYVVLYSLAGYFLGSQWQNNLGFFTMFGLAIFSLGVVLNTFQYILYRKRRRNEGDR